MFPGKSKTVVIATVKSWNIDEALRLSRRFRSWDIKIIDNPKHLTFSSLKRIRPEFIFFPHWSWKIPALIYTHFECVVFHMTDLPYGRGGSPLQNLILRGHTQTKVSALKAVEGMDEGPVYLKKSLDLSGSAEEIYRRASMIIFREMIPHFFSRRLVARSQKGKEVFFKRRRSEESNLSSISEIKKLYDFIRMLDAEGYPRAFLETEFFRLEFNDAEIHKGVINARVQIKGKT